MDQKVKRQNILDSLNARYATKQFDPKNKISQADWEVLEKSLVLTPSSYGLQPLQYIVVENEEIRKKLREVSWNQSQITDASHIVVFTYKTKTDEAHIQKYINRVAEVRDMPAEALNGYKEMMVGDLVKGPRSAVVDVWASRQSYIAMGFLMETAALLGIDTCPMEGLDPKAYDQILKLEGTGFQTVAVVALGFRSPDDQYQNLKKVRFKKEDLIKTV